MSDDDHYAPTRRLSARPPVRFAAGTDFDLCFKRFELYVAGDRLSQDQLCNELLYLC